MEDAVKYIKSETAENRLVHCRHMIDQRLAELRQIRREENAKAIEQRLAKEAVKAAANSAEAAEFQRKFEEMRP